MLEKTGSRAETTTKTVYIGHHLTVQTADHASLFRYQGANASHVQQGPQA